MDILSNVIVLVAIVLTVVYLVWQIKMKGLRQVAINLIVRAEEFFQKGENTEKLAFVVDAIFTTLPELPKPLRSLITKDTIKKIIKDFVQDVFNEIKIALDCK